MIQVLGRNAPAEFRAVPCPSEEEVDILVIGDSSCARVEEPNDRYPTKHHVAKLLQKLISIKQLLISVFVMWGGNDVFSNYGYVGCRWIHEKRFNRTEAGRKAASEWPKVQRTRVYEQLDFFKEAVGLGRIRDITFICNPDVEDYGLTSDYNDAMNGCIRHLADVVIDDGVRSKAIDSSDASVMTLLSHRYDDVHMTYSNANRKVVSKFLHAAINTQLLAQRIRERRALRAGGAGRSRFVRVAHLPEVGKSPARVCGHGGEARLVSRPRGRGDLDEVGGGRALQRDDPGDEGQRG